MNIRRHARIAKRAHQDGIKVAGKHGEPIGRDSDAIGEIALRAPVKRRQVDRGLGGHDDLNGFGDDFPPDPVSGDEGDALFLAHGRKR